MPHDDRNPLLRDRSTTDGIDPSAPGVSQRPPPGPRRDIYDVVFGHDTVGGRVFDALLLLAIAASIVAVMLESVPLVARRHPRTLFLVEWTFTVLFSIEFVVRLACVRRPLRYAMSFYGLVDLVSILPAYLALYLTGTHELLIIRSLRLLRIFRVLKLGEYLVEAGALRRAMWQSRAKIIVFLATVLTLVLIVGSIMHLIEGPEHGFTSIPIGIYWAIVTLTTVGYGDISPQTPLGQMIASLVMIVGYGIIAVPTGIVTAELVRGGTDGRACPRCGATGHLSDARYCRKCAERLNERGAGLA